MQGGYKAGAVVRIYLGMIDPTGVGEPPHRYTGAAGILNELRAYLADN